MSIQYISFTRQRQFQWERGITTVGERRRIQCCLLLPYDLAYFQRLLVVFAQIFGKLICNFSVLAASTDGLTNWLSDWLNAVNVSLARIRSQSISCGAYKLCANKLLFVKWLCIRSSTFTYYMCTDVCLSVCRSVCQSALELHLIAHEYVSW